MDLFVNSDLIIPSKELNWRFSRASGPGGQNTNKTDSRVELVFDLKKSNEIGPLQKDRLMNQLSRRLVNGCLRVVAAEERSQFQNRKLALSRLGDLLREGLKPLPKTRKQTKRTFSSHRRRLKAKKLRSELKQNRKPKDLD